MEKKYTIKIEEVIETQDKSYPKLITVYEQTVMNLDIEAVIKAVNKLV